MSPLSSMIQRLHELEQSTQSPQTRQDAGVFLGILRRIWQADDATDQEESGAVAMAQAWLTRQVN